MKRFATTLVVMATISATPAFALTYNVNENFTGTFVEDSSYGTAQDFLTTYDLTFSSLNSGDASLFSSQLKSFAYGFFGLTGNSSCNGPCSLTETLKNGDKIFATFTFNGQFDGNSTITYSGNATITGGTGLFTGATGTGTFSGVDIITGLAPGSDPGDPSFVGTTTQNLIYSINTPAVPEPETYALLLTGLGLVGFSARRKQKV